MVIISPMFVGLDNRELNNTAMVKINELVNLLSLNKLMDVRMTC